MERFSPVLRMSLGLVVLTCAILLAADFAGLLPPLQDEAMRERISLCEGLSVQVAQAASRGELASVRSILTLASRRHPELLSAGVRSTEGSLWVQAGEHRRLWGSPDPGASTPTHMRVPLFRDGKPWATLEVRFAEVEARHVLATLWRRPLVRLLLVVGVIGFAAYGFYLNRNLKHLDPSAVIPARVQAALDVMGEGVILVDARGRIVLANTAFAERLGTTSASLLGVDAAGLGWLANGPAEAPVVIPWTQALREGGSVAGSTLRIRRDGAAERVFVVNASPVLDGWGAPKGAIATFDDATELEQKTLALEHALAELEKSRDEIRLQNDELQVLARRDPLTGIANRRAFVERFEEQLRDASRAGREVCCLMADIDRFKHINDVHGHAMGDEVIKLVAQALSSELGSSEDVCRYGGEEFCVTLPDTKIEQAVRVAERVNKKVQLPGFARVPVTVSLGVASTRDGARAFGELIEQADRALYASKKRGRNRVTCWHQLDAVERKDGTEA
ncbi:MAG TPA: diguanylate cyclase [Myxococcota bacterium]|nr:diguanylate cyclase [Myxococcota bacterium]